ncbi:N-acyl homoserine lactonase [Pseudomonas syringae]|uniref:N-acyl homoserine lactonase n=1 Tax=Pseudomonas syringae TaxID=317 RepID=UPI000A924A16|nr:N-acyl homoserine lactonase [Pseudomonas syringae]
MPPKAMSYSTGELVAWQITERFNETRVNCGTATQPAFLCSGVLIRYADFYPTYHVWDNSIEAHTKGGVSFGWLRTDSQFIELLGEDGYLFSPPFYAIGKLAPEVLCSFPQTALSFLREGTGCGAMPNFPTSEPCQSQGVTSASGWYDHFTTSQGGQETTCGFDVRRALGAGATTAFIATLEAMELYKRNHGEGVFARSNELVLAVWPDGEGRNLPLQAFWYNTAWNFGARENAQRNQLDFKNVTGLSVPITAIQTLHTAEEFRFDYLPEDQVIDIP